MRHITVDIPDGISPYNIGVIAARLARAAEQAVGHTVEVTIEGLESPLYSGDLSRPQELAADRVAATYGRTATRRLPDGAVEITGLLDDVEMGTVCIELDGRERWRR